MIKRGYCSLNTPLARAGGIAGRPLVPPRATPCWSTASRQRLDFAAFTAGFVPGALVGTLLTAYTIARRHG